MSVLLRGMVAIPMLFLLIIVAWITGQVVPPIAEVVLSREAVEAAGFAAPADTILKIGLQFVLALLGLVVVLWWIFGDLRRDVRQTRRPRR